MVILRYILLVIVLLGNRPIHGLKERCRSNDCELSEAYTTVSSTEVNYNSVLNFVKMTRVEKINFVNSSLLVFPTNLLTKLPRLQNVTASNVGVSNIKCLGSGAWKRADNLRTMILSHNNLTKLNDSAFVKVNRLTFLDLSYNQIDDVGPSAFSELELVMELVLTGNRLQTLPDTLFSPLLALKRLQLNENRLAVLDLGLVKKNVHLIILGARKNAIETILCAEDNRILNALYLSDNKLEDISNLTVLTELKNLYVANNPIKLDDTTFVDMPQLTNLDLDGISFQHLDKNYTIFKPLVDLELLSLGSTKLDTFVLDDFPVLAKLTHIYLDSNNLTTLDFENIKRTFPKLETIGITENRWDCVFLRFMVEHFERIRITLEFDENPRVVNQSRYTVRGVECYHSAEVHDMAIKDLASRLETVIAVFADILEIGRQVNETAERYDDKIRELAENFDEKLTHNITEIQRQLEEVHVSEQLRDEEEQNEEEQNEEKAVVQSESSVTVFLWTAVALSLFISTILTLTFIYLYYEMRRSKPVAAVEFSKRNSQYEASSLVCSS